MHNTVVCFIELSCTDIGDRSTQWVIDPVVTWVELTHAAEEEAGTPGEATGGVSLVQPGGSSLGLNHVNLQLLLHFWPELAGFWNYFSAEACAEFLSTTQKDMETTKQILDKDPLKINWKSLSSLLAFEWPALFLQGYSKLKLK